jgi:hypothetical protein
MSKCFAAAFMSWVALSGCGGARGGEERMKKMVEWKVEDVLHEVDATEPQRLTVTGLKDSLLAEAKPLVAGVQGTRKEFVTEWKAKSVDAVRVHQAITAQANALEGFVHKVADAAIALHDVLTPKQRELLTQRIDKT